MERKKHIGRKKLLCKMQFGFARFVFFFSEIGFFLIIGLVLFVRCDSSQEGRQLSFFNVVKFPVSIIGPFFDFSDHCAPESFKM